MHSRKIRVPAMGIVARLGPGTGELINVSLTGALVCLDQDVVVNSVLTLQMSGLEVECRVVRCGGIGGQWLVAVVFTGVPSQAARGLRELVADMYERVGASRT